MMASDGTEPYRDIYPMVVDPATYTQTNYFLPNTRDNGRIWADKSVGLDSQVFKDVNGETVTNTITGNADEFLVTLSAMSQNYDVQYIRPIAVDAVFVIDLSGSMAQYGMNADAAPPPGQPTRDVLLVQALNTALDEVMSSSEYSRIAVVGYTAGGTTTFLELDHYSTGPDGIYFDLNTTGMHNISVNANVIDSSGISHAGINSNVDGGTNTQMGIVAGGNILEAADTQLNYSYNDDGILDSWKTRRPVLVLMTDGDPTWGWLDFASTDMTSSNVSAGTGVMSGGDIGTDLVTILTGQAVKNRVSAHYVNVQDPVRNNDLFVYTVGVGVNSVHAQAVMDPAGTKTAGVAGVNCNYGLGGTTYYNCSRTTGAITTYNLKTLLDSYVAGNNITFPMLNFNSYNRWGLRTLTNDPSIIDYRYADEYFMATDEASLNNAFDTIAGNITAQGGYTTIAGADPNLSGYVAMTDVIGRYMEVRNFKGVLYKDTFLTGAKFAQQISPGLTLPGGSPNAALNSYANTLALAIWPEEMITDGVASPATIALVRNAIQGSIKAGSIFYNNNNDFGNVLKIYTDNDLEYIDSYYDSAGNIKPVPSGAVAVTSIIGYLYETTDNLTGEITDLAYMIVTVDQALEDSTVNMRFVDYSIDLKKRQQIVRWYIPASLIPTRAIDLGCEDAGVDISVCDPGSITMEIDSTTMPIRLTYAVGLWSDLDADEIDVAYTAMYGDGDGGWYFYSNDWSINNGGTGASMVSFEPNQLNPYFYFPTDTVLYVSDGVGGFDPATSYSPGTTYFYNLAYYDINVPGFRTSTFVAVDPSMTTISLQTSGVPYIKAKTKRVLDNELYTKSENITETSEFVKEPMWILEGTGDVSPNGIFAFYLGNNGRLHMGGPTTLTVDKIWEGEPLDSVWVQLFKNGAAFKDIIELTETEDWSGGWDNLFQWKTTANQAGRVSRNVYTVSEGYMEDGHFYIYTSSRPMVGYGIKVIQPVWQTDGTLSNALLYNTQGESGVGGNDPDSDWALVPDTGTK